MLLKVVGDFVLFDDASFGSATMFGGRRGWEMPFHKRVSRDERDVVQIDNLDRQEGNEEAPRSATFKNRSNLG